MGTVIDFYTARPVPQRAKAEARCRCTICGADLWHINQSGEVCCADCETVCPYRLQSDPAEKSAPAGRRQADCGLGRDDYDCNEDDLHA